MGDGSLDGLHLVEDGLGELVRRGLAAHVARADLAKEEVSFVFLDGSKEVGKETHPSAMTP